MSGTTLHRCDGNLYYLVGLDKDSCAGQWESLEEQGLLNTQQAWIPNLTQQMPGYRPPSDLRFPWLEISQISCKPDLYKEYQVQLVQFTEGSSGLEPADKEGTFFLSTLYPPSNQDGVAPEIFDIAAWSIAQFIDDGIILSNQPDLSKVRYAGLSIECLDDFFRHGRFDGQPPNTPDGQILSRDKVVFFVNPSQFDPMRSESYDLIATDYSTEDRSNLKMLVVGLRQQGRIINPFEAIPGYTGHECGRGSWLEINSDTSISPKQFNFGAHGSPLYRMGVSPAKPTTGGQLPIAFTNPLDAEVAKLAEWLRENQQR